MSLSDGEKVERKVLNEHLIVRRQKLNLLFCVQHISQVNFFPAIEGSHMTHKILTGKTEMN